LETKFLGGKMTQTTTRESQSNKQSSGAQDASMQDCITDCLDCAEACNSTLSHCLSMGGKHVESMHIKNLMACAEICALSAQWMARKIEFHSDLCRTCAAVCKACAKSCESIGADDETMQACMKICNTCADSCSKMAAH